MNRRTILNGLRKADISLSRRLSSNLRRVLVDARTPMNFAVIAPIWRALKADRRIEFYFTSTDPANQAENVFKEQKGIGNIIKAGRAALTRFDAYLAADLIWAKLPRGAPRVYMFHGVAGK